jgi:eukaryotic-like serine/threonine-protein kinase
VTPERWQEVKAVLAGALERTPEQRSAYLDANCAEPEMRREVESLLVAEEQAPSGFLAQPALSLTEELAVGCRLGVYEIVARVGAGGMGDVYHARDTKLGRSVAIKVLPLAFVGEPERLLRFQREARILASLNHPNIATIHGFEQSGETQYLVMELVPGITLAERLQAGPLELPEALAIAQQICAALESAHEQGIIHRDLKPANVEVVPDGRVKVLDFGLAKAFAGDLDADTQRNLAKAAGSEAGAILGTPTYMSPEQVRGKSVDKRADIWAFGCVFYEMLSGRRAFDAESVTEVLVAVLTKEPDWSCLPQSTPPAIQRLLRRCLVKEPKQRLRDIGDARITIEEVQQSGESGTGVLEIAGRPSLPQPKAAPQSKTWRRLAPWALAAVAIPIATLATYVLVKPKKAADVVRFSVSAPANTTFRPWGSFLSMSPDGRKLAFVVGGMRQTKPTLMVRTFDSLAAESFPGVDTADFPFWSPDSRYIGFFSPDGKLEKVSVSGGPPQVLCNVRDTGGGTWNRDGVILFSDGEKLYRIADVGGAATPVAVAEQTGQESYYFFPQFLPDGRHFLFFRVYGTTHRGYGRSFVEVGSLDSAKTQRLFESLSEALYAPPGYLLYVTEGTLVAQAFDVGSLRSTGQPVPISTGVGLSRAWDYGLGYFSPSQNGVLAYQTGATGPVSQMTWYNRKGETLGTVAEPAVRLTPALSHDETKIAVPTGEIGESDIWLYDLKRGAESRLTVHAGDNFNPVWSPDDTNVLYSSWRSGHINIYEQAANGLGNAERISESGDPPKALNDISPDGRYAIYDTAGSVDLTELWVQPLSGRGKPFPFVQGGGSGAREAHFSPDGRYVAYASHESGKYEIYVQTFPQHLGKWQISTNGGEEPAWRADGKELFYLSAEDKLMAVDVNTAARQFQAAIPKALFQAQLVEGLLWRNRYVVTANGQQFLMLSPVRNYQTNPITVVLNWPALLQGK